MASTKNSQNIFDVRTSDQLEILFSTYFTSGTNTEYSFEKKLEMIRLVCFLQQVMKKKDPVKYANCKSLLGIIFEKDFNGELPEGIYKYILAFGILCDDLMYFNEKEITKPEGYNSAKDIKDEILKYFNAEWLPF